MDLEFDFYAWGTGTGTWGALVPNDLPDTYMAHKKAIMFNTVPFPRTRITVEGPSSPDANKNVFTVYFDLDDKKKKK